jgi:uncharacterized protein Yka (UPF0111/DUF47 family)
MGKYFLGQIDEEKLIKRASSHEKTYAYLFIGMESLRKGNKEKGTEYLQKVIEIVGPKRWRTDLARVEIESIGK